MKESSAAGTTRTLKKKQVYWTSLIKRSINSRSTGEVSTATINFCFWLELGLNHSFALFAIFIFTYVVQCIWGLHYGSMHKTKKETKTIIDFLHSTFRAEWRKSKRFPYTHRNSASGRRGLLLLTHSRMHYLFISNGLLDCPWTLLGDPLWKRALTVDWRLAPAQLEKTFSNS